MKMKQFDFYEFTGVIAPGTVILLAAGLIWPDHLDGLYKFDVTVGGFGLVLLLAYIAGHLLQAIGNLLEFLWWKFNGGWPSDWPRTGKGYLLSDAQIAQLEERVRTDLGFRDVKLDSNLPAKSWHPIFRQIYAVVRAAGRDSRAHTFNGNYGMFRGIASATIVSTIAVLVVKGCEAWPLAVAFSIATGLAIYRMHRFAKHYARETYVQFLALPRTKEGKP
ncbi:MAG TPA: hypothetical protein ENJ35_10650 [Gammaproteobacteria bacterium]|nr:hypothetical protein [Gammaproteobacteria bacterium]